jgi:hypothetical protein
MDFALTFCDPITMSNEYDIPYKLANHSTAYKWFMVLYEDIYVNKRTWNNNRYVGFEDLEIEKRKLKDDMLEIIEICKKEHPVEFNIHIKNNIDQDEFNHLHTWFEIYRGELDNPHPFFVNGSDDFKYAIERFNQLIHMWEVQDEFAHKNITTVNIDFNNHYRIEMDDSDYENFEFFLYSDSITLPFISRGKNLIDFWINNDKHVGEENIRKYRYIASNFKLRCSGGWTQQDYEEKWTEFNKWFQIKSNYLNNIGFYWNDPKSCKGYITLAHSTIPNTKDIIKSRQYLKNITIYD